MGLVKIEIIRRKLRLSFLGLPTSDNHFGRSLAGADVIGGHTLVRAAVSHFNLGDEELAVTGCLRPRREAWLAHPAPLELNSGRAVSKALHAEGFTHSQLHHVRQAGGVRRGCGRRGQRD